MSSDMLDVVTWLAILGLGAAVTISLMIEVWAAERRDRRRGRGKAKKEGGKE